MNSASKEYIDKSDNKGAQLIGTHDCLFEDVITIDYNNVVNEERQHLFDVNFRVLVPEVVET
jgi:hypothetical protein